MSSKTRSKTNRSNYDESEHTDDLPGKIVKRRKTVRTQLNEDDDVAESVRKEARQVRISHEEEEILLSICVKYFDDINDTSTIRGIPGSTVVKQREERQKTAWQKVTNEMNAQTTVSIEFLGISMK